MKYRNDIQEIRDTVETMRSVRQQQSLDNITDLLVINNLFLCMLIRMETNWSDSQTPGFRKALIKGYVDDADKIADSMQQRGEQAEKQLKKLQEQLKELTGEY